MFVIGDVDNNMVLNYIVSTPPQIFLYVFCWSNFTLSLAKTFTYEVSFANYNYIKKRNTACCSFRKKKSTPLAIDLHQINKFVWC
jgi:hypothetical protein